MKILLIKLITIWAAFLLPECRALRRAPRSHGGSPVSIADPGLRVPLEVAIGLRLPYDLTERQFASEYKVSREVVQTGQLKTIVRAAKRKSDDKPVAVKTVRLKSGIEISRLLVRQANP